MKEDQCYLFFSGYYVVAASAEILRRHDVESRIVRAPVSMRGGCNFALLVDGEDVELVRYLLEREKIRIERIVFSKRKTMK